MSSRSPQRLPRGRHRLSREEVVRDQRERILRAMAETMVTKGYVGTSVADVLRAAGVSRETFYQQFSSKEDCFMSAYEAALDIVMQRVAEGAVPGEAEDDGAGPGLAQLDRALAAYLDALADEPAVARLFLVEIYAAGPAAMERRVASQRQIIALVAGLLDARSDEERFVAEAFVAATIAMVTTRIAAGDVAAVRALHEPLTRLARRLTTT